MNFAKIPNLSRSLINLNNPQRGNIIKADSADVRNMSGNIGQKGNNSIDKFNYKKFNQLGEYNAQNIKPGNYVLWKKGDKKYQAKIIKVEKEGDEIIQIHILTKLNNVRKIFPNQIISVYDEIEHEEKENQKKSIEEGNYLTYNEIIWL